MTKSLLVLLMTGYGINRTKYI